ncbi:MAG: response regulator [Acidobacteria bacterium]|nr:response regulator [Acidobacteriota bacterium]
MNQAIGKLLASVEASNDLILESLLEGVAIIDASRNVVFANRSALKMLGSHAGDIVGRPYDIAFFNTDKSVSEELAADCPIQFALSEGAASHMLDGVFVRADGSELLVEFLCTPIIDGERIDGAVVSFQDVTQRREIERAVADARDAAVEAARTKAAFLANISHEIRTPLSGIVGTANLLAETDLSPEQTNLVELLKQSIGSLLEIVNDILDFSKIEAGKLKLHLVSFDLRALIDETLTLYSSSAEAKGLSLTAAIDPGIEGSFRGDSGRLRQILSNLISNALKFTHQGSVTLTVRRADPQGDEVCFEVIDTGIGIGSEQLSALFQPFTQGDISTTRRFGGTGLGLAISRELVEMMNGSIGVESVPGEGSRFWFNVRLTRTSEPGSNQSIHISESPTANFSVLLAEDHPISSEIIRKMLEQAGCSVTVAADGAAAVELAGKRAFDLILMDCQMPEIDGYAATELIRRSDGPNRSTKIIALSAHAEEIERENCLRAGMDDFLCKPLTPNALSMMFETHFADHYRSPNLDLDSNLIHHLLASHVTPEVLANFSSIEARGEKDFVSEIFQTYFRFAVEEIAKIESAVAVGDLQTVKRRAHALKGSSANVGLSSIVACCLDLERSVDSAGDLSEAAATLGREFNKLRELLREKL